MNTNDERNIKPMQEMLRLVQNFSNLNDWNFREGYRSIKEPELIYDSEWCRIAFVWGGWDYGRGNSISIHYGRLHAPNESTTMLWNGEECYAWHEFDTVVLFLEGNYPAKAAKMKYSPSWTKKFFKKNTLKNSIAANPNG